VRLVETVARGVERLSLTTPTLPPATDTNTYFVARDEAFYVVEPATPYEEEQRVLRDAIEAKLSRGMHLLGFILTHHHRDHVGAAARMREVFEAPVLAHRVTAAKLEGVLSVDAHLEEGASLLGHAVQVLHTPGHAPGHLCLREQHGRWLIAGDMVASVGTIVIDPDDGGEMTEYLAQLDRLASLGTGVLLPAHGAPIEEGEARLRYYVQHRLAREARVLSAVAALGHEGASERAVVERAYADTPEALWPIALRSARAHLIKLAREGKVRRARDRWWIE
jgi:ribonuclease/clavin/mitogillin